MKKITLLKSSLNRRGGIEKNVWQIANAFLKKGFHVKILTSEYSSFAPPDLEIRSFPIRKNAPSFYKILEFDKKCEKYLREHPCPIVFSMDRNTYQTHIRAGNGSHRAFLQIRKKNESYAKHLSFLINPLHRVILNMEKKAFESPDLKTLFVNSQMVKKQILTHYRIEEKKMQVLYNGVEWNQMQESFEQSFFQKEKLLEKWDLSKDSLHLLFVGNGYARKGLLPLLKALSILKEQDFKLFVIGKDKKISHYKNIAIKLGIYDKVIFAGVQKNLHPYYQLCDALVLPTIYDPFANVTLEALSMGLYVITSIYNGAHEILNPFHGQILEDPLDHERLSYALSSLLNQRKDVKSAQFIRNSVQSFDYSIQLDRLIDVFL